MDAEKDGIIPSLSELSWPVIAWLLHQQMPFTAFGRLELEAGAGVV